MLRGRRDGPDPLPVGDPGARNLDDRSSGHHRHISVALRQHRQQVLLRAQPHLLHRDVLPPHVDPVDLDGGSLRFHLNQLIDQIRNKSAFPVIPVILVKMQKAETQHLLR